MNKYKWRVIYEDYDTRIWRLHQDEMPKHDYREDEFVMMVAKAQETIEANQEYEEGDDEE